MSDLRLLSPEQINEVITDMEQRNKVISEFSFSNNFYKQILAFWLGNENMFITHLQLKDHDKKPYKSVILVGYCCLLSLDKNRTLLHHINASDRAIKALEQCQLNVLRHYNEFYRCMDTEPEKMYLFLTEQADTLLHANTSDYLESQIINQTRVQYLAYLNALRVYNKNDIQPFLDELKKISLKYQPVLPKSMEQRLGQFMCKTITTNWNEHLFPRTTKLQNTAQVQSTTLLIKNREQLLLSGLYIKSVESNKPSKKIILALVGHFPWEQDYIAAKVLELYALFGHDLVLINHRDYANRSGAKATHITQLSKDVVDLSRYFREQELILYGMCGGAMIMTDAAQMLQQEGRPYQLIVDRAFMGYEYHNDRKTLTRFNDFSYQMNAKPMEYVSNVILFIPLLLVIHQMGVLLLRLSNTNVDLVKIIRAIPESDVLILQARSPQSATSTPKYVDLVIPDDNEMREAVKDRRQKHKHYLKILNAVSTNIMQQSTNSELSQCFGNFLACFRACLQLLSDEKLVQKPVSGEAKIVDLHTKDLFNLSTRSELPVRSLLQGFFNQNPTHCNALLQRVQPYTHDQIAEALAIAGEDNEHLAEEIFQFLTELADCKHQIASLANRSAATRPLFDIKVPLEQLFAIKFMNVLENQAANYAI